MLLIRRFALFLLFLKVLLSADHPVVLADDTSCAADAEDPTILRKGVMEVLGDELFGSSDGEQSTPTEAASATVPGGEAVKLRYVKSFLSLDEVAAAIGFCDGRDGWTASRQTYDGDGSAINKTSRTSSSCPLIWPLLYLPKLEALRESGRLKPELEDEIQFAWKLMQRISNFLKVDAARIEPLQLIRYEPGQFYRQHHDHGSYYGATTEQRPITFLLFLSTMPASDGGGHTKFGELDIAVLPRAGDGIIWNNVDEEGNLLMDAVHEAVPPKESGSVKKFAMNVWIAQDPIMNNIDTASYRTS
mmetsp:Transcript_3531/g.8074  ORF Transcript_3531/g.8074 Transcript_3531/m.8074 type:complete len:303 (-) Transcript_3531:106-1014(-)